MGALLLHQPQRHLWLAFQNPIKILLARQPENVSEVLQEAQIWLEQGYYVAGAVSYEAGYVLQTLPLPYSCLETPLLWLGVYGKPLTVTQLPGEESSVSSQPLWQAELDESSHNRAVTTIQDYIAQGHTYQVNYTYRLQADLPWDDDGYFFRQWQARTPAPYAGYLNLGRWRLLSASPELFFARQAGGNVICRPMKGTAPRQYTPGCDRLAAWRLHGSPKERAENLMIVDMVRNDLGRIAQTGSIQVPHLFSLEAYPTVWQLTSTVTGESHADFCKLWQALFPCASITGAPKRRTMETIAEQEVSPRGFYCGSLGYWGPDGQAQFNVAIRTLQVDRQRQQLSYGTGGGIVWDSQGHQEWQESRNKCAVLRQGARSFDLLESLLWRPGLGYWLLPEHLRRLRRSARYFGFPLELEQVRQVLTEHARQLTSDQAYKVRLLCASSGSLRIASEPLPPGTAPRSPVAVGLARQPVFSQEVLLYHKTTWRLPYEEAAHSRPDYAEVLLYNELGQVTEACYHNIVFRQRGCWYTPPVRSGLLAGVWRQVLLKNNIIAVAPLHLWDLAAVEQLCLINSVRGWRRAWLPPQDQIEAALAAVVRFEGIKKN